MDKENRQLKRPASEQTIFRNMMITIFTVSALFLLKNLLSKTWSGVMVIGICLFSFVVVLLLMNRLRLEETKKQIIICISVAMLVFCISINSGSYYSDDFPLYLAVVGIGGMFLKPQLTLLQGALIMILLAISYAINPQKADPLGQYIMCMVIFGIATYTFYMVIKRGRTYIELGETKTREAQKLLSRLQQMGEELEKNCQISMEKVSGLESANQVLEGSKQSLQQGSGVITHDTEEVSQAFDGVHEQMQTTQEQIGVLNGEVKKVEISLGANRENLKDMAREIEELKHSVNDTYHVFASLQEEILEISNITGKLNKIAEETTMLALNASIEAARAGTAGAGFAVVASKVQNLAEDSNQCAGGVVRLVNSMKDRIDQSFGQLDGAAEAITHSSDSLKDLLNSFDTLTNRFGDLYENIEEQNYHIQQMDEVYDTLREKIGDMAVSSEANQQFVDTIGESINIYRQNIQEVIEVNKAISNLSGEMMAVTAEE